jgi:hypothetical protein
MTPRDNIIHELNELKSSLANASQRDVYQVPAGYFEGLPDQLLKRVKALEAGSVSEELEHLSPLLNSISKAMPYSVPEDYFSTLENELRQTIASNSEQTAQEELEILSPLLSGLKNQSTFTVPRGYFENLQPAVHGDHTASEAKLVSITSRKWFRYAAAAVVTGFIVTIGFLALNKENAIDPETKSYAWVKSNLKKVSTDDINEFVELAKAETAEVVKPGTKEDISNLLKDVSDNEIQEFLNDTQLAETGTEDDLILN